jgi:tetratricopeptide (TPR) repeat protein
MGQKLMKVSEYDLGTAVPREAGDNETVVIVRSAIPLEFESTMDKTVDIYNVVEESGFIHYYIKFSTLAKFKGRKLKMKSYGFETHTEPLVLTAKVPLGLLVIDPDGSVGVGCYFLNLNEGNKLYAATLYEDARTEYLKALECSDLPEENDLAQKIEDAGDCAEYKRNADNLYNSAKWEAALREYEKIVALNVNDAYSIEKVEKCLVEVAELPRIITGKVIDSKTKKPLAGVVIKAGYDKKDKKGNVQYNKNGEPKKTEYQHVGTTNEQGLYKIVVKNKCNRLQFSSGNTLDNVQYKGVVMLTKDNNHLEISLSPKVSTSNILDAIDKSINILTQ